LSKKPFFSIITCTYNRQDCLRDNIESVVSQTYKNYEHIFIDANSTDNTVKIIKEYQKKYPSIIKFFQYFPKGISNAMNKGIKHSTGRYLIHLHSDDSLYSNKTLDSVFNFLKNNHFPDWIYGKAVFHNIVTNKTKIIPYRSVYYQVSHPLLLLTNYIPHQATFIKKKVFIKNGNFNESYKCAMDYEYWLRLSKLKVKSAFINEIICHYTIDENAQSYKNHNLSLQEMNEIRTKYTKFKPLGMFLNFLNQIRETKPSI